MGGIAGAPGLHIDPTQVLHGEHYLELMQPLSRSGTLTSISTISDVLDKGSGAVIVQDGKQFLVLFNSGDTEAVSGDFSYCHPQTSDVTNNVSTRTVEK